MDFNDVFNDILGPDLVSVIGPSGGWEIDHGGCNYRKRIYSDALVGTVFIHMSMSADPNSGRFLFYININDVGAAVVKPKDKLLFKKLCERFGGRIDKGSWILDIGLGNPDLIKIARNFVGNIMLELEKFRNQLHYEQYFKYDMEKCHE